MSNPCGICEYPRWIHNAIPGWFDHSWEPYLDRITESPVKVETAATLNIKTSEKGQDAFIATLNS